MKLLDFSVRPDKNRQPLFDGIITGNESFSYDCLRCDHSISQLLDDYHSTQWAYRQVYMALPALEELFELTGPYDNGRYTVVAKAYVGDHHLDYGSPLLGTQRCPSCEQQHLVCIAMTEIQPTRYSAVLWAVIGVAQTDD